MARVALIGAGIAPATRAAQARWRDLGGAGARTHYAGAYWFHGFHEDGVRSGQRAADAVIAAETLALRASA